MGDKPPYKDDNGKRQGGKFGKRFGGGRGDSPHRGDRPQGRGDRPPRKKFFNKEDGGGDRDGGRRFSRQRDDRPPRGDDRPRRKFFNKEDGDNRGRGGRFGGERFSQRRDDDRPRRKFFNKEEGDNRERGGRFGGGRFSQRRDDDRPRRKFFNKEEGDRRGGGGFSQRRDDDRPRRKFFNKEDGDNRGRGGRFGGERFTQRRDDRPPRDNDRPRRRFFNKEDGDNRRGGGRFSQRRDDDRPRRKFFNKDGDNRRDRGERFSPRQDDDKPRRKFFKKEFSTPFSKPGSQGDPRLKFDGESEQNFRGGFRKRGEYADKTEKLQKVLARSGLGSRRLIETWIEEGRISINGETATLGARAGKKDELRLDGKPVRRIDAVRDIILYNKPRGKIVEQDAEDAVFDDLPPLAEGRWLNIGRLDVGSEGLLLFTTDGEFVEQMAHPRNGLEREYRARVNGALSPEVVQEIRDQGIRLGDDVVQPVAFSLDREGEGLNCWYRVVLSEGRNRVVRRIFEEFGLEVNRLLRVRFGDYRLPPDLPPGEWRRVSPPARP